MKRLLFAILIIHIATANAAQACSVPVFRWALERWQTEDFQLYLFRDKPLSVQQQSLLREVTAAPENVTLREIAVTEAMEPAVEAIYKQYAGQALPFVVLDYPQAFRITRPAMVLPLAQLNADTLRDSPARRELARRILDGQSGVWLFVLSGNGEKDAAALATLKEQVARANQTLKLPDMAGDQVLRGPDAPDISRLRVEFSIVEVRRDDPAEAALVSILLGVESDLAEYAEPLAFPVYGRGRVLYALVGRGINADTVMKANAFLVGPCACEIKAENPGTDLLMPVDWAARIGGNALVGKVDAPPLAGTALPSIQPPIMPVPAQASVAHSFARNAAIAVAAAIVLVLAGSTFLWRRGRQ
jgi:hypothetical protein